MVLNPFFTQGTSSEQNLVQDLINEQLRTYGVDIFYLPRKYLSENSVIREVVQSKFDIALPLEAYIDNYDQYSGAGNLFKAGIPIGRMNINNLSDEKKVEFFSNFSQLKFVKVVSFKKSENK